MRPYLAAIAVVTLWGVASHAAEHQQQVPPSSTQQRPTTPPKEPEQPAPSQPAAPQPQAQLGRVFGSDAGMIWNPVKPDRTMDFEMVMARLKEALALSEDPVRKQQAAGWKVFRALEAGPNASVLYVFVMDPAVKGADYTISKVLNEAFPSEVQELYKLYIGASTGGQTLLNLTLVQNLGEVPDKEPALEKEPVPEKERDVSTPDAPHTIKRD